MDRLPVDFEDAESGYQVGRAAALSDWAFRKQQDRDRRLFAVLMNKRWEARNPERAAALHRKATAAWKRRDPEAFKASLRRRKVRYRQRHADRVKAQNRASYLAWAAKPGNLEAARQRAAERRRAA